MRKPTIRDVAEACGVSTYVVSLSLRERKGVARETKERVKNTAELIGYRVNPAASLMGRRRTKGTEGKGFMVGYLVDGHGTDQVFLDAIAEREWSGKMIWVEDFDSPARISRLLWQEGYDGLLLGSGPHDATFWQGRNAFEWAKFPVVKMSRGLPDLRFNLVRHSAFDFMWMALLEVWEMGFRNFGVLLHRSASHLDNMARLGAVLSFQETHAHEGARVQWKNSSGAREDLSWLRDLKPQVAIVDLEAMAYQLIGEGLSVPDEMSLSVVIRSEKTMDSKPDFTGCLNMGSSMYRKALDQLQELVLNGNRGFQAEPTELIVQPRWNIGNTCRDNRLEGGTGGRTTPRSNSLQ